MPSLLIHALLLLAFVFAKAAENNSPPPPPPLRPSLFHRLGASLFGRAAHYANDVLIHESAQEAYCHKLRARNTTLQRISVLGGSDTGRDGYLRLARIFPIAWVPFIPVFSCPDEERVGHFHDGGKWVCGVRRLPKENCVVYSIGSNGQDDFERGIKALAPQCDIHTFDPGDFQTKVAHPKVLTYHRFAIGTTHDPSQRVTTIQHAMTEMGHTHIDVFKMDIEGSEYPILPTLFGSNATDPISIGQLQVEFHFFPYKGPDPRKHFLSMKSMMDLLHNAGLHMFHAEPNVHHAAIVEFAFVNISTLPMSLRPRCEEEEAPFGMWPGQNEVPRLPRRDLHLRGSSEGLASNIAGSSRVMVARHHHQITEARVLVSATKPKPVQAREEQIKSP